MDGFGPDCVNVNEKDKEPGSETENSENLYNSDRPSYSSDIKCMPKLESSYQWAPVTDMEPILPPIIRRSRGRPTKRRRLEPDEVTKPKLS
ncbi:hypothetical protein V6N11_077168 [Hibiscus sabdariffa]|uniref:Uncharacterized protein n=1 Tax=Hibiscus sabdariffa TaxID=183260 RepID=A0ABR2TCZ0_9ROSI